MTEGNHISLFAGAGMTDLAVEKAGFKTVATAEIDPFKRRILEARFPDAAHFEDVRTFVATHAAKHRLGADPGARPGPPRGPLLISGGFPCGDTSAASMTQTGVAKGARSGLWGEFARIIGEFRPDYAFIENSPLLRKRGLNVVLSDLAQIGYDCRWDCIPAAAVGAPHLRDRMFILAWPSTSSHLPESPSGYAVRGGSVLNLNGGDTYITDLPRAGRLRNRYVYEETPAWPIREARKVPAIMMTPTITKADGSGGPGTTPKREGGKNLRTVMNERHGNGRINPEYGEWMMGLPLGWTDPNTPTTALRAHPGWIGGPHSIRPTVDLGYKDRGARIKTLGDGLVPQAALAALELLSEGAIHA